MPSAPKQSPFRTRRQSFGLGRHCATKQRGTLRNRTVARGRSGPPGRFHRGGHRSFFWMNTREDGHPEARRPKIFRSWGPRDRERNHAEDQSNMFQMILPKNPGPQTPRVLYGPDPWRTQELLGLGTLVLILLTSLRCYDVLVSDL